MLEAIAIAAMSEAASVFAWQTCFSPSVVTLHASESMHLWTTGPSEPHLSPSAHPLFSSLGLHSSFSTALPMSEVISLATEASPRYDSCR